MADPTVEDWIRGYLLTYLPDSEATETLVANLVTRMPEWVADRELTGEQRESLEEHFGGESATLLEIIEGVLEGVDAPPGAARIAAKRWLDDEAPDALSEVVGIDDELPPVYTREIRREARAGLRDALNS